MWRVWGVEGGVWDVGVGVWGEWCGVLGVGVELQGMR